MVALIVGLKWRLLRNGLRRSPPQLVGLVFAVLYGLGVLVSAMSGLIALRFSLPSDLARTAIILGGSLVTIGWAILPVVAYGMDETLDPARFATFAVPRRQLVVGLLLSSLVSVPAAVTAILGLGTVITWSRSLLGVLIAPVAAAVGVLTCVALGRVTSTAFFAISRRRSGKEALLVLMVVSSVGLAAVISSIMKNVSTPGLLADLADILGWSPVGLAWAVRHRADPSRPVTCIPGDLPLRVGLPVEGRPGEPLGDGWCRLDHSPYRAWVVWRAACLAHRCGGCPLARLLATGPTIRRVGGADARAALGAVAAHVHRRRDHLDAGHGAGSRIHAGLEHAQRHRV